MDKNVTGDVVLGVMPIEMFANIPKFCRIEKKIGNPILHPTNLTELRDVAAAELPG